MILSGFWTVCITQTDSCICGEQRLKAIKILGIDANAWKEAYLREHITRLADSAGYTYIISVKDKRYGEVEEALKIEQAKPKIIQEIHSNKEWYLFSIGGVFLGGIITWLVIK